MTSVLVVQGSANPRQLTEALPGVRIDVVDQLPLTTHPATAVVLRSGTALSGPHLDALSGLRHVVRPGSGTDNVDVAALAARDITLHRNPCASADAVAEWTVMAALSVARRAPLGHNGLIAGVHLKAACSDRPLADYRVGIWGTGPVGLAAGRTLGPFVRDIAYAQWPSARTDVALRPAEELTAWADLHVVALPLRESTRAIFGPDWIDKLSDRKPALICVGRVGTLDLPACLRALDEGELSGLAIDAIDPDDEHPSVVTGSGLPRNLLVTPHIGAQRTDVRAALDRWTADTLQTVLTPVASGRQP